MHSLPLDFLEFRGILSIKVDVPGEPTPSFDGAEATMPSSTFLYNTQGRFYCDDLVLTFDEFCSKTSLTEAFCLRWEPILSLAIVTYASVISLP